MSRGFNSNSFPIHPVELNSSNKSLVISSHSVTLTENIKIDSYTTQNVNSKGGQLLAINGMKGELFSLYLSSTPTPFPSILISI